MFIFSLQDGIGDTVQGIKDAIMAKLKNLGPITRFAIRNLLKVVNFRINTVTRRIGYFMKIVGKGDGKCYIFYFIFMYFVVYNIVLK